MLKIMPINDFANRCGYFYNAYIEKNITCNNGYNCRHPEQGGTWDFDGETIGCCYAWSCPLAYEADEEDFADDDIDNDGYETWEEGEFVVVDTDKLGGGQLDP